MTGPATGTASGIGRDGGSVIHDIGYQRYTGPRLGRGYAVRSLYTHSLRTAFGLGRGVKAKIFPWSVVALIMAYAAVATAVRARTGVAVVAYPRLPDEVAPLTLLFLAIVAPELVSRDLRSGVLALYFSRPLRRADYALVKLAALTSAAWLLLAAPQLLMFLGGAFGGTRLRDVWHEWGLFWPGLAYAAMYAVLLSAIALLVASLSRRRAVAAGTILAVFLVSTPVTGLLFATGGTTQQQLAPLASPVTLLEGLRWFAFGPAKGALDVGSFGPLYVGTAAAVVALCAALLVTRYRRVES